MSGSGAVAIPAPGLALPGRSRPARPGRPPRSRPARRRPAEALGIALRIANLLTSASKHRLLERLTSGRVWIGLVAFALIGIVTMQLLVLTLNTSIGRALQREAALQGQNTQRYIENSSASSGPRVEQLAAGAGMILASPGAVHFLAAHPGDARPAAAALANPVQAPAGGSATTMGAGSLASAPGASSLGAAASTVPSAAGAGSSSEGSTSSGSATQSTPSTSTSQPAGASPSQASAGTSPGSSTGTSNTTSSGGNSTSSSGAPEVVGAQGGGTQAGPQG